MNLVDKTAEEDFNKARNKALFNEIQHFLSPEEASLISLNDVKQLLRPTNETYVGMKVVPIDKIVGSEGTTLTIIFFQKAHIYETAGSM